MMRRFARLVPLQLLLLVAALCSTAPTHAAPATPTPRALQRCLARAKATAPALRARAEQQLAAIGLRRHSYGATAAQVAAARKARIDETHLLAWTRATFAESLCSSDSRSAWKTNDRWQTRTLLTLLGQLGSARSYGLLTRLAARGAYHAHFAREAILARQALSRGARASCRPPSAAELLRARGELVDLLLVESHARALRLRAPTRPELDDLAYFYAAVRDAGPEVGAGDANSVLAVLRARAKRHGAAQTARARAAAQRAAARAKTQRQQLAKQQDTLYGRLQQALRDGDLSRAQVAGVEYLETVGYPWSLTGQREQVWAWGGARYSFVMRDLAMVAELRGETAFAAELYRVANPGGGLCGTSTSSRWLEQLRGAIRSAEAAGRCREALPERLLEIERGATYGTARLARAGFDVARLLRGALLLLHRDLPRKELLTLARQSGARTEQTFLARLQRRGVEDWERRVRAIEGLADVAGKAAVDPLVAIARSGSAAAGQRALQALAKVVARPDVDPCQPSRFGSFSGSSSNIWSRQIRSAGRSCKTSLRPLQAQRLLRSLLPLAGDADAEVRAKLATVLGALALPSARATLERLARDPYGSPHSCRLRPTQTLPPAKGATTAAATTCVPIPIVAEAATAALSRLRKFERRAPP